MGEKKFLKGDTVEAQLKLADIILQRLARRSFKTASIIMPQIPMMTAVQRIDEDGVIGRFLMPLGGYIKKAYMYVDTIADKAKPVLSMTLFYDGGSRTETLTYRAGPNSMTRDVAVPAGSRLVLTTTEPESVTGVSLGLIFEVDIKATVKEEISLDTLLANVEKDNELRQDAIQGAVE